MYDFVVTYILLNVSLQSICVRINFVTCSHFFSNGKLILYTETESIKRFLREFERNVQKLIEKMPDNNSFITFQKYWKQIFLNNRELFERYNNKKLQKTES